MKIAFLGRRRTKQTLYYFSTNLADGSFERSGFSAFLLSLVLPTALSRARHIFCTKDTSPACGSCCSIAARLSFRTIAVSRLPISKQGNGDFSRLGIMRPISIFTNFYQPQMAELFNGARPIEFGIGYRWRKNESNLLLAQKESSPINGAELTLPSQAEGNAARTAAPSPKKTRKRVETEATRSAGCRSRESSRSVGKSKLAGVPQAEDIVAVEVDLVGWGNSVRYGRGTNVARYLQAGHNRRAANACALFCSGHNIWAAA